jgi:hypothetical protein
MISPQIEVGNNPQLADLVQQVTSQTAISLTLYGEEKAVILSAKTFRSLLNLPESSPSDLLSWEKLSQQYESSIAETGCDSREKILDLIQAVKRELAVERDLRLANRVSQES